MKKVQVRAQKINSIFLLIMCILINMLSSLSTDMYLPALSDLCSDLTISTTIASSTVSAFMLFFALGTLLGGPLCDKYGRKPLLLIGSIMFLIGNIMCTLALDINVLLAGRIIAGIGAGSITSVSFAIIKDCFKGKTCERNVTIVQSIAGLGPVIGPVLGGFALTFVHWRGLFCILAIIGVVNLIFNLFFQETLDKTKRVQENIVKTLGRLMVVFKVKNISFPLLIFAFASFANLGYVGVSSYIFTIDFGVSKQLYSVVYAISAFIAIFGPLVYASLFLEKNKKTTAFCLLFALVIDGVCMILFGSANIVVFFILATTLLLITSIIRPFSMNILFAQQTNDSGSISSLYNAVNFVFGSIGATVCAMDFGNRIITMGVVISLVSGIELICWLILMKSRVQCYSVK